MAASMCSRSSLASTRSSGGGAGGWSIGSAAAAASTASMAASPGPSSRRSEENGTERDSRRARLRGVVCSPHEVSAARRLLGDDAWLVVPGIRRRTDPHADQVRVATARDAVYNGATHLVVGRPILQAADPAAAFREFMEEAQWVAH